MNIAVEIHMNETDARAALGTALKERAEAAERADELAAQFVAARKVLDAKEGAYIAAHAAHDAAVGSCDDAAILKAFHKVSEPKALWDAAKKTTEQAATQVDRARLQCEAAESAIDKAVGQVVGAIAEERAKAFNAQWCALIAEVALLHAARRLCGTVPPELARIFQLGVIDVAANDSRFAENFKASRTALAAFVEKLTSDPAALFEG
jgi:hypothetical protein